MTTMILACPECPGVRYEGEPCKMCAALKDARAAALAEVLAVVERHHRTPRAPYRIDPEEWRLSGEAAIGAIGELLEELQGLAREEEAE